MASSRTGSSPAPTSVRPAGVWPTAVTTARPSVEMTRARLPTWSPRARWSRWAMMPTTVISVRITASVTEIRGAETVASPWMLGRMSTQ